MPRIKALPARLQSTPQRAMVSSSSWRAGNQKTAARGYGNRWQVYRKGYLADHPLCVKCSERKQVTAASVVDHVIPHRGDMKLFWDPNNHQALCKPCHDGEKAREEAAAGLR